MRPDQAAPMNRRSRAPRAASLVWLFASLLLFHWGLPVAASTAAAPERSTTAERGTSPAGRTERPKARLGDLAKAIGFELRTKDGKSQVSSGGADAALPAASGPALSTASRSAKAPELTQLAAGELRAVAFEARAPPARPI